MRHLAAAIALTLFAAPAFADTPTVAPSPSAPASALPTTAPPAPAPDGGTPIAAPAPEIAPPPAPLAPPPPVVEDGGDPDGSKDKNDVSWWPSLLLEPGAGAVVSPAARGGATFGFSMGVVRLSIDKHNDRISSLFGWHAGYTVAPGVDRGEVTLTAGTGITGPFVLSLRAGPTIDTNGVYGLRAGLRGTVYHGVGLELFMHHGFQPRNDTSVFMVFSLDLVPATLVLLFVGAMNNLFK